MKSGPITFGRILPRLASLSYFGWIKGSGGGVGVACSLKENAVPGSIPELNSAFSHIFNFSFCDTDLAGRAFCSLRCILYLFQCSLHGLSFILLSLEYLCKAVQSLQMVSVHNNFNLCLYPTIRKKLVLLVSRKKQAVRTYTLKQPQNYLYRTCSKKI